MSTAGAVPVSVVISTRDRPEPLLRCLDALAAGVVTPHEVVVVDQSPGEQTSSALAGREYPYPLRYLRQQGTGVSRSQNLGLAEASCAVVAVVDDDCVPDERWLSTAAALMLGSDALVLLTGRIEALPSTGGQTLALSTRTSREPRVLDATTLPWDAGSGGSFAVRRAAYLAVEGNDERLGPGSEGQGGNDLDLFRKLLRSGGVGRYEPDFVVAHARADRQQYRARRASYGSGLGACLSLWRADGDPASRRLTTGWLRLRLRRLWHGLRTLHPRAVADELVVLWATARGMAYGRRLTPR